MKCSPRTDSERFSSSREQPSVNTGQNKVLIYPRVWRSRISWITSFQAYVQCLHIQEWLTVKWKVIQLLHNISLGVICKQEYKSREGFSSVGLCFSRDSLYNNCNINQSKVREAMTLCFYFLAMSRVALKGSQWRSQLVQYSEVRDYLCITLQHPQISPHIGWYIQRKWLVQSLFSVFFCNSNLISSLTTHNPTRGLYYEAGFS